MGLGITLVHWHSEGVKLESVSHQCLSRLFLTHLRLYHWVQGCIRPP